jgi:CBS domain-containing protein
VFLHIPHKIRLERLISREIVRYGPKESWSKKISNDSKNFIEWASMYDDPEFDGRNITLHKEYISRLKCPTITIEGDTTIEERMEILAENIE